jgi:hypothetical protein
LDVCAAAPKKKKKKRALNAARPRKCRIARVGGKLAP